MHGAYKNLEGLQSIVKNGLLANEFASGREAKYKYGVSVWNLNKDYLLKDYINFYSGGTILYSGIFKNGKDVQKNKTDVIPYNKMNQIIDIVKKNDCHMWVLEQTKEARFMPSLVQDRVQIGIIFASHNKEMKSLLKNDILNRKNIKDNVVKSFVNPNYYEKFLKDRKKKDDFFTDRESSIIFGIPSNLIEGILVGRTYEKDTNVLDKIKQLLPDVYICNINGKVIVGNK